MSLFRSSLIFMLGLIPRGQSLMFVLTRGVRVWVGKNGMILVLEGAHLTVVAYLLICVDWFGSMSF